MLFRSLGNFRLLSGAPATGLPPIPPDQEGTLSVAIIKIKPYTYTAADAVHVSTEAIRITQRGLQNLAERIERLEYWNTINSLEQEVYSGAPSADVPGLFTDALTGFGRMDLQFSKGGIEHTAALDRYERRLLLPASKTKEVIKVDLPNSTHVRKAGNTIMLDYQPSVVMSQPYAGITVNGAADFVVNNYYGTITMSPAVDAFIDSQQLPAINVDFDNSLSPLLDAFNAEQRANNIEWGEWNRTRTERLGVSETDGQDFFGHEVQHFQRATAWSMTRSGTVQTMVPGGTQVDLGNRVVDMTIQGMMRTTYDDGSPFTISLDIRGLVPNADHACTFYGKPVDLTYDSSPANAAGQAGSATYQGKSTAKTSNDGCLTATIIVPSGVPVGTAEIVVFYHADPDISIARNVFTTVGFMQSNQSTTVGMPGMATETVEESGVWVEITRRGWDPLAQTFTLKNNLTYVSGIRLYFSSKPSTGTYTVQVRDTVNGYPGPNIIASTTLYADDVDISSDGSVYTTFTFNNVVGYKGGTEYCFVGLPGGNSTEWNLYAAELGTIDLLSGLRIGTQVHDGVLFHSPNARTWEPWTKRDLKFDILESNFENDCQIVFENLTGLQASRLVMQFEQFVCPGVNVKWSYSVDGGTSWDSFNPRVEVNLETIITQVQLRVDITSTGGNYQIIDEYAGILLLLHEDAANYIGTNQYFTDPLYYPNAVTVTLDLDTDGTNGGSIVSGTDVTPYVSFDDGETWTEVPLKSGYTPVAKADPYYTYAFELTGLDEFSQMRPRLTLGTGNQARTPSVQNIGFVASRL